MLLLITGRQWIGIEPAIYSGAGKLSKNKEIFQKKKMRYNAYSTHDSVFE
jgi:hypothetical protein